MVIETGRVMCDCLQRHSLKDTPVQDLEPRVIEVPEDFQ
jgi:hypothetical protein